MIYVCCKNFNKYGFHILKGATLNVDEYILYYSGGKVCFTTSQDSYDYFARNDDGKGRTRYKLTHDIIDKIIWANVEFDANEDYAKSFIDTHPLILAYDYIREEYPAYLKEREDIFTNEFYTASVDDLTDILTEITKLIKYESAN